MSPNFWVHFKVPLYLFEKRDLNLLDRNSVCVVWSRKAFKWNKKKLVKSFIKRNIVVNTGFAKGINNATHTATLENGDKTLRLLELQWIKIFLKKIVFYTKE